MEFAITLSWLLMLNGWLTSSSPPPIERAKASPGQILQSAMVLLALSPAHLHEGHPHTKSEGLNDSAPVGQSSKPASIGRNISASSRSSGSRLNCSDGTRQPTLQSAITTVLSSKYSDFVPPLTVARSQIRWKSSSSARSNSASQAAIVGMDGKVA